MSRHEFAKASHFCGASKCRFGMTTVVNDRYIISSVGDYWPTGAVAPEPIGGAGPNEEPPLYETYVFELDKYCAVKGCPCGGMVMPKDWTEIDGIRATTEAACRDNHAALVEKWEAIP